jgi:hypothetical protein
VVYPLGEHTPGRHDQQAMFNKQAATTSGCDFLRNKMIKLTARIFEAEDVENTIQPGRYPFPLGLQVGMFNMEYKSTI